MTAGAAARPDAQIAGLECRIGHGRMLVPMAAVSQVGQYRVGGRLPATARHVAGVGAWADQLVVSLSLVAQAPVIDREVTGILLETAVPGPMRWALEIIAPVGIVEVAKLAPNAQASSRRPTWLHTATMSDGRTMLWIAVEEMIAATGVRR